MRMVDLIEKKKLGGELSEEEIRFIVNGFTKGEIPDYQVSAFLMAVCFNHMTGDETFFLTDAMRKSGDVLDLSGISGVKVDKHSSGGVGDKTTLTLSPIVSSLGIPVAKMSGRGLGHTGGTIDKLESYPGFVTSIPEDRFIKQVNDIGICVAGQTKNLAPADKKLYALRDITATVAEPSLIASSIMSKKLSSGADAIVLDVKVGDGAFMKTVEEARHLAKIMVKLGKDAGKKTTAVLTSMEEPLGNAVGNILEVREAYESLKGNGPKDFMEVVYTLGTEMLILSGKYNTPESAKAAMEEVVENGSAAKKYEEWIIAQGGDPEIARDPEKFDHAKNALEIKAGQDGYVGSIKASDVGHAVMSLGGGRATKDDVIDLTVGTVLQKKVGDKVSSEDTIAVLYGNDEEKMRAAAEEIRNSYKIVGDAVPAPELILDIIR